LVYQGIPCWCFIKMARRGVYVPGIGFVYTDPEEAKQKFLRDIGAGRPTFTTGGGGGVRPPVDRKPPTTTELVEAAEERKVTEDTTKGEDIAIQKFRGGERLTDVNLSALRAGAIIELRKERGTFGAGLGEAREFGILTARRDVAPSETAEGIGGGRLVEAAAGEPVFIGGLFGEGGIERTVGGEMAEVRGTLPVFQREFELATGQVGLLSAADKPKAPTLTGMGVELFKKTEERAVESFTEPALDILEKVGLGKEDIARGFTRPTTLGGLLPSLYQEGAITGALEDIEQRPLTHLALFGAGGLVGAATKGAGVGVRSLLVGFPRTQRAVLGFGKGVSTIGGIGLGGVAVASLGLETAAAPTPEEMGKVFGKFSVRTLSFGLGALGGRIGAERVTDILAIRSLRRKGFIEIPFEDITIKEPFAQAPRGTTPSQLVKQFREQRIITKGGIDKRIKLPGDIEPFAFFERPGFTLKKLAKEDISLFRGEIPGVNVFTASVSGPRGKEFAAFLGKSREPGPFFAPQLSKEFLGKDAGITFFDLRGGGFTGQPVAFRTKLKDVTRLPRGLLFDVKKEGVFGFKGFASPSQQRIISFRAEKQDPLKAIISTRFEISGGEIESIGRAGGVQARLRPPRLFTISPKGKPIIIEETFVTGKTVIPEDLITRIRPTAIVRDRKGILLTYSPEEQAFILPGGGVGKFESLTAGLGRELLEETGLKALTFKQLKTFESPIKRFGRRRPFRFVREELPVFEVEATGKARPLGEIKKIAFFKPGKKIPLGVTTKEILKSIGQDVSKTKTPKLPAQKLITKKELKPFEFTSEDIISRAGVSKPEPLFTPGRLISSVVGGGGGQIGSSILPPIKRKQPLGSIIIPKIPKKRIFPLPGSSRRGRGSSRILFPPPPFRPPPPPFIPDRPTLPTKKKKKGIVFRLPFGMEDIFKLDPIFPKRKFRRIPSLAAVELGIFAPKPLKAEITGLGIRPVIK